MADLRDAGVRLVALRCSHPLFKGALNKEWLYPVGGGEVALDRQARKAGGVPGRLVVLLLVLGIRHRRAPSAQRVEAVRAIPLAAHLATVLSASALECPLVHGKSALEVART